jgi:hypothetical protein
MHTGYLFVETHGGRPGLVRIAVAKRPPVIDDGPATEQRRVRYLARFNDGDAALMHVHALLRRHLVDVNSGLYRVELVSAIAAAQSLDLTHERLYLDPQLGDAALIRVETRTEELERRRRLRDRLLYLLGYLALAVGLLHALMGLVSGAGSNPG